MQLLIINIPLILGGGILKASQDKLAMLFLFNIINLTLYFPKASREFERCQFKSCPVKKIQFKLLQHFPLHSAPVFAGTRENRRTDL